MYNEFGTKHYKGKRPCTTKHYATKNTEWKKVILNLYFFLT